MKEFSQREIVFIDEGKVYSHNDYRTDDDYRPIMAALEIFKYPTFKLQPGSLSEALEQIEKKKP